MMVSEDIGQDAAFLEPLLKIWLPGQILNSFVFSSSWSLSVVVSRFLDVAVASLPKPYAAIIVFLQHGRKGLRLKRPLTLGP